MYDIYYELLRQEHSEAINYASRWSFWVYCKVQVRLGAEKAGETANKVYAKILEREGVPCQKNQ